MALEAGDAREGTGLAGLMAEKMKELEKKFDVKKGYATFDAIAQAIVEHIQSEMEVEDIGDVTLSSPAAGEQLTFADPGWENGPDQT